MTRLVALLTVIAIPTSALAHHEHADPEVASWLHHVPWIALVASLVLVLRLWPKRETR